MFENEDFDIDEEFLSNAFKKPRINDSVTQNSKYRDDDMSTHVSSLLTSHIHNPTTVENTNQIENLPIRRNVESILNNIAKDKFQTKDVDANTKNFVNSINSNNIDTSPIKIFETNKNYQNDINLNKNHLFKRANISTSKTVVRKRKFPGPAGLLPECNSSDINKSLELSNLEEKTNRDNNVTFMSQTTGNFFNSSAWAQMMKDYSGDNPLNSNFPKKYTILWLRNKVKTKRLIKQKTPFLAAVIENIEHVGDNHTALLKDRTGEIQGIFDDEVWDKYKSELNTGAVIVLRQVSVLVTNYILKKHYLNITVNNIVVIYNCNEIEDNNSDTRVTRGEHYLTYAGIYNDVQMVEEEHGKQFERKKSFETKDDDLLNNRKPAPHFNHGNNVSRNWLQQQSSNITSNSLQNQSTVHSSNINPNSFQNQNAIRPMNIAASTQSSNIIPNTFQNQNITRPMNIVRSTQSSCIIPNTFQNQRLTRPMNTVASTSTCSNVGTKPFFKYNTNNQKPHQELPPVNTSISNDKTSDIESILDTTLDGIDVDIFFDDF